MARFNYTSKILNKPKMVNAPEGLSLSLSLSLFLSLSPPFGKIPHINARRRPGPCAGPIADNAALTKQNIHIMTNTATARRVAAAEKFRTLTTLFCHAHSPTPPFACRFRHSHNPMPPFARKVSDGRSRKPTKWQCCQIGLSGRMHISGPTLPTGSYLDFLPSGNALSDILQSTQFKLQR